MKSKRPSRRKSGKKSSPKLEGIQEEKFSPAQVRLLLDLYKENVFFCRKPAKPADPKSGEPRQG